MHKTQEPFKAQCLKIDMKFYISASGFGGLVVSMLASGTQDRGVKHGLSLRIFRAKTNPSEGK
jgi:hypothetical protein